MENLDLTEIHKIELEMLKAVAALCDRYSLRYSIYCGTLLGAVRHKGFIPWDDDIDLAMPLDDYRKFLEHAAELPPGISCIHYGNTRDFTRFWAKVAADGTTFMPVELAGMDIHWGISLDIYPMIGTPDTDWGRKIHKGLLQAACKLQLAPKYRAIPGDPCFRFCQKSDCPSAAFFQACCYQCVIAVLPVGAGQGCTGRHHRRGTV